jgi:hypothetical protein
MKWGVLTAGILVAQAAHAFAAEPPLPVFTEVTEKAGIRFTHSCGDSKMDNIVEGTGAGCMFFDYDGDGWLDIFLVTGRYHEDVSDNTGRKLRGKCFNKLYRNNRDGTFTDVTEKAGVGGKHYSSGCSAADFDGDGDLDLYVLNYGPNELYRNNGDGTFTDVSKTSGLADPRWSLAAGWFDYNGDGKLDVYVVNYLEYDKGEFRSYYPAAGYPGPLSYKSQPDALYRNNGDGTFTEVSKEAGIIDPDGRGMSIAIADFDNDGKLDIYVTNDASANFYFRNLGGGKFAEEGLVRGLAFGQGGQDVASMGPVVGDVDHDGRLDVFVPAIRYGSLHLNRGAFFEDMTDPMNLAVICGQYTGWGAALFDYDNDGFVDIFQANGDAHHEHIEEAILVRNNGQGRFIDVARQSGECFNRKCVSRGVAVGDYDNDGDLDILVNNLNEPPRLLRNDGGNRHHWLTVIARLPNGKSNAVGARVSVTAGGVTQFHHMGATQGYLSQFDPRVHFGLGKAARADRVEIRWLNGKTTVLKDVPANQFLQVVQPSD